MLLLHRFKEVKDEGKESIHTFCLEACHALMLHNDRQRITTLLRGPSIRDRFRCHGTLSVQGGQQALQKQQHLPNGTFASIEIAANCHIWALTPFVDGHRELECGMLVQLCVCCYWPELSQ
jgi:hypothetical protein